MRESERSLLKLTVNRNRESECNLYKIVTTFDCPPASLLKVVTQDKNKNVAQSQKKTL